MGNAAFSFPGKRTICLKQPETNFWLYAFRRNEHLRGLSPSIISALTFQDNVINTELSAPLLLNIKISA